MPSPSDGSWVDISKRLESVGTIGIAAKRRSPDIEYFNIKKQEIVNSMKTQIETIERFNNEFGRAISARLTSNVRGINGILLLYAAIGLMPDKSLIERILLTGGDPRRQNKNNKHDSCCTPLELALSQYKRCQGKAKDLREKGRSPHIIQHIHAQDQRCAEAKSLLDMLKLAR